MSIVVLSLDIAMGKTGWAVGSPSSNRFRWGIYETNNWCKATADRELRRFKEWVAHMHVVHNITHVAIEEIFVNANPKAFNFSGTQAQMQLQAIVLEYSFEKIKTFEVSIAHWRQRFLGLSRKPKDVEQKTDFWKHLAVKVCAQKHNIFVEHFDEAEALDRKSVV